MKLLKSLLLAATVVTSQLALAAPAYFPVGPQTAIPVATVTAGGWTQCYMAAYNVPLDTAVVLAACTGPNLMLACRPTGNATLQLLAAAPRADVIFDTNTPLNNTNVTHAANGSEWYFSPARGSWGFARGGDAVNKGMADISPAGTVAERLSWHIPPGAPAGTGGFRCGASTFLNNSAAFERVVYHDGAPAAPATVPTLSEWALVSLAMLVIGFGVFQQRRRQS